MPGEPEKVKNKDHVCCITLKKDEDIEFIGQAAGQRPETRKED